MRSQISFEPFEWVLSKSGAEAHIKDCCSFSKNKVKQRFPNKYRPISSIQVLSKVYSNVLLGRLATILETTHTPEQTQLVGSAGVGSAFVGEPMALEAGIFALPDFLRLP